MSKKNDINEETNKNKVTKPKKRKKTAYEKRKFAMKIAGWVMAAIMIIGSLISIFGMLIYR